MDSFFGVVFVVLILACVILRGLLREVATQNEVDSTIALPFSQFKKNFLIVYYIVMGKVEEFINALTRISF
jgi:hypothetical protein